MGYSMFKYDYYRYYGTYKFSFIKWLFRMMPVERSITKEAKNIFCNMCTGN